MAEKTYETDHEKDLFESIEKEIAEDKVLNFLQKKYDCYDLLDFNEFTIGDRIQKNPYRFQTFKVLWIKNSRKLTILEDQLKEREAEIYNQLKFHDPRKLTKTEIERYYIHMDEEVKNLKKKIMVQKIIVDYMDAVVQAFERQHWAMKNYIETGKGGF